MNVSKQQLSIAIQALMAIKGIRVHGPGAFDSPRKGIADAKAIAIDALNALTMVRTEYVPPADCIYPNDGMINAPKMDCPAHSLHVPEDQCKTKTVEGFALDDTYRLCFTLLTFEYRKGSDWLQVGAYIEHNESQGKRRPYVVIHIGKLAFQSGWLFDNFCCGMCEPPTAEEGKVDGKTREDQA